MEIVTSPLASTAEPTTVRLLRWDADPAVGRPVDQSANLDPDSTEVAIPSAEAPRRFEFRVEAPDGATLRLADSGAIGVIDPSGTAIAVVEAASATDAQGQPVPTHYEVDGMTISQIVDHDDDTAHPVVTYPRISAGRFVYVRFNRQEVKDFAARGGVVGAATLMGMVCRAIPVPWITAGCLVAVAVSAAAIINTFNKADEENKCVEIRFDWDGSLAGWKRYTCR